MNNRRGASHDGRCGTNRCRHDQTKMGTWRRWYKDALWSVTAWTSNHTTGNNTDRNRDPGRWRYKAHAGCGPVTVNKNHRPAAIFIIGIDPAVAWLWWRRPASMGPDPVSFPGPVTTGPNCATIRNRRRVFNQHRWWCPANQYRFRLHQRRFDINTHYRLRRWLLILLRLIGLRRFLVTRFGLILGLLRWIILRHRRIHTRWLYCTPGQHDCRANNYFFHLFLRTGFVLNTEHRSDQNAVKE